MHDPRVTFRDKTIDLPVAVRLRLIEKITHEIDADTAVAMSRTDKSKRYSVGPERARYISIASLNVLIANNRSRRSPATTVPLRMRLALFKVHKRHADEKHTGDVWQSLIQKYLTE